VKTHDKEGILHRGHRDTEFAEKRGKAGQGGESKEGCDKVRKWEYGHEDASKEFEEAGEID
jgi:hypothetical protein